MLNLKKTNLDGDSDDEIFDGETLTWRQVGEMTGANPKKRSERTDNSMKTLDFAYIFGVKTTYFWLIPAYLGSKPDCI